MKDKFIEALKNANSKVTKSKLRDSIKSQTHFEVNDNKFILEVERFLSWGHLLHTGITNIPIEANLLLYRKDSGDEHYIYCDVETMNELGILGIHQDLNKIVQDIAKEIDLSHDDLNYTIEKFNERTDGFNRTINRFERVDQVVKEKETVK